MKIAIVAPFCSLPNEPHFNRFQYLAQLLSATHDVVLITSQFKHYDKAFRSPEAAATAPDSRLQIRLLPERGYQKNVSLARLISHHDFVRALERELQTWQVGEYDVVYAAYPLMGSVLALGKHKARLGYKLVVDVQDVWPESFSAVLPAIQKLPPQALPFAARANRAYACADALVAVSQTYLNRALQANPAAQKQSEVVYIGADVAAIERAQAVSFVGNKIRFFYLGTLSYSYDMATVCEGISQMAAAGQAVALHIMGGGPDLAQLKAYESEHIIFHGFVPYERMMALAKGCDIAINPIHAHAAQTITNKLSDYMVLQKPILNSQIGEEVSEVLRLIPHQNYQSGNVADFIRAASALMQTPPTPPNTAEILRRFQRDVSYLRLQQLIEHLR